MNVYQIITACVSILSFFVAVIALSRSKESLKLSQASVEVSMRNQIQDSMRRVEDYFEEHADFLDQAESAMSEQDKKKCARLRTGGHSRISGYLSALDVACGKYIDGKIDKTRFKKDYQREIRQAVQHESHKEFLRTGNAFHALLRVYNEWENPERE